MSALQVLASQLSAGTFGEDRPTSVDLAVPTSPCVTGHGIRGEPTKVFNPAVGKVSSGSAAFAANDVCIIYGYVCKIRFLLVMFRACPSARAPNATPKDHTPTGPSAPDKNENSSALSRDPPGEMESSLWNAVHLESLDSSKVQPEYTSCHTALSCRLAASSITR